MKKICLLVLMSVLVAQAQTTLKDIDCNIAGNPDNSCRVTFSQFKFGQNFGSNGTNMFFFEDPNMLISIKDLPSSANASQAQNKSSLPIRFFILSTDAGYNSAMSLIHTAYVSRASVNVIFMNPIVNLLKDEKAYKANSSTQQCYVNRVGNNPFSILCPVMSITLAEN